ncbi:MAG: DMT family transporter, partial [Hyphomonadaceae bacterium]
MFASISALSCMDATIKYLSAHNHVLAVAGARYVLGSVFACAIWVHAGRPTITREMLGAHFIRAFFIAASACSFFWAIRHLPLVEIITLTFVSPLVVPLAAWVIVGERPRPTSLAAASLGFAGVIVAVQGAPPGEQSELRLLAIGAAMFSAITFAISVAMMRARARTDHAASVGFLASALPCVLILPFALVFATPPRMVDWPFFLLVGVLAAAAMYLMARAYSAAEAQQLAPIHYTELIWAGLIGYFIFQEAVRPEVLMGAVVIIGASLFAAWDERRLSARAKARDAA